MGRRVLQILLLVSGLVQLSAYGMNDAVQRSRRALDGCEKPPLRSVIIAANTTLDRYYKAESDTNQYRLNGTTTEINYANQALEKKDAVAYVVNEETYEEIKTECPNLIELHLFEGLLHVTTHFLPHDYYEVIKSKTYYDVGTFYCSPVQSECNAQYPLYVVKRPYLAERRPSSVVIVAMNWFYTTDEAEAIAYSKKPHYFDHEILCYIWK